MEYKTKTTITIDKFGSYEELREFHEDFPEFVIYHDDYNFCPKFGKEDNLEKRRLEAYHASYSTKDIFDANLEIRKLENDAAAKLQLSEGIRADFP